MSTRTDDEIESIVNDKATVRHWSEFQWTVVHSEQTARPMGPRAEFLAHSLRSKFQYNLDVCLIFKTSAQRDLNILEQFVRRAKQADPSFDPERLQQLEE